MSNMKIMNCPCCSSSTHLETMKVRKGWEANICCNDCGLNIHTITFDTEEEAINIAVEKWNKRKPMERIVEKLEQKQKNHKEIYDRNQKELEWTVSHIDSCKRIKAVQGNVIEAYDYSLAVIKEEGGLCE